MIDAAHPLASWYLWVLCGVFLVLYALPLLLAPLKWSRLFQWKLPQETDLAVYFGRCVGGLACGIVFVAARTAPRPAEHPLVWELLIAAGALLTLVHVVGAVQRSQPWTEDAEIVMYGALTALSAWIYAGL